MMIPQCELTGRTILAPLAGISNLPFRRLVKSCGCAMVCTEMISARGLYYNPDKTLELLKTHEEERPLSVQIFGADPGDLARAAGTIETLGIADVLDINFGCSVKKVLRQGAGAALMQDMARSRAILRAVRQATRLPVTLKMRTGWDPSGAQAIALARVAEEEGICAVTIHPRTARQGFSGHADWQIIREVRSRVSIMVIGNGDITRPEHAREMICRTGCDAVMIGRAALTDPFLLSRAESCLAGLPHPEAPARDLLNCMTRLVRMYVVHFGEEKACRMLRGRLSWFIRGLPGSSALRREFSGITSQNHALDMIHRFEKSISLEKNA